ncbi:hypothetical protein RISK_002194 [Rhodopirellula islandica]|uniref:Uncharacterized protein n=1 Tax=Rhodopirellula islandica TaxID=595434 RepID=A0A0J1BG89_RHOIS|nr:hypothetical protein RISK_002194 [Rhodopirellula islandica]
MQFHVKSIQQMRPIVSRGISIDAPATTLYRITPWSIE